MHVQIVRYRRICVTCPHIICPWIWFAGRRGRLLEVGSATRRYPSNNADATTTAVVNSTAPLDGSKFTVKFCILRECDGAECYKHERRILCPHAESVSGHLPQLQPQVPAVAVAHAVIGATGMPFRHTTVRRSLSTPYENTPRNWWFLG
jgi:hypothetical protein